MGWFNQEEMAVQQKAKALVATTAGGSLKFNSVPNSHFTVVNFSLIKPNCLRTGESSPVCRVLASRVGSPEFDALSTV